MSNHDGGGGAKTRDGRLKVSARFSAVAAAVTAGSFQKYPLENARWYTCTYVENLQNNPLGMALLFFYFSATFSSTVQPLNIFLSHLRREK